MNPYPLLLLAAALVQSTPTPASLHDEPLTVPAVVYPADAKARRLEGSVELQINVDAKGTVTSVNALSGPAIFRGAAVEAYSHATYRPLLKNGVATPAVITTTVHFALHELPPNNDLLVDRDFEPLHQRCKDQSAAKDTNALATCRQAVEVAQRFTPHAQLEARASAYNDLVLLLIGAGKRSKQLREAEALADQAIELIAQSSPNTPAVAVAYITRAEVRSLDNELPGAAEDCAMAEEILKTLLADEAENERAGSYRAQYAQVVTLHQLIDERERKHQK